MTGSVPPSKGPRITLLDIETTPNLGWTWKKWEDNVLRFEKEWQLLCFAYRTYGTKKTHVISRLDFPKDKTDYSITKEAYKVLCDSQVVVAHNGLKFDVPKLRAKFVEHGLPPPPPFKVVDTRQIARSQFMFNSNSLNDLAFTLKLGAKKDTGGIDLWFDCMNGDAAAWKRMISYNRHDVDLLHDIYARLRPWSPSHPNMPLYQNRTGCPVCSSLRVQRRGYEVMQSRRAARYQCQEDGCGKWFKGPLNA